MGHTQSSLAGARVFGSELGGEESDRNVCGVDLCAKEKKKGREIRCEL